MCYSIAYLEKKAKKLAERYRDILPADWSAHLSEEDVPAYHFVSGFSHPALAVIQQEKISVLEWGLIPFWVKDAAVAKKIRPGTLNAVGETVFEKPSFKDSIPSRRCLLPVNGFFEWREVNGKKYPYFIQLKGVNIFSLGCIYDSWTDKQTGEVQRTFSILTTPANPMMEKIHNTKKRMPLIIPQDEEKSWVDPTRDIMEIKSYIIPYKRHDMEAYPVSRMLNNVRHERNIPQAVQQVNYPELNNTLFD
jgi:putative SOS response-associated peptidase YedK